MICKKCYGHCTKNGFQNNGKQRYNCKRCHHHQQEVYSYQAYTKDINQAIYKLVINSCGIADISRVLGIAKNTVSKRILILAKQVKPPTIKESCQSYEVDELCTNINGRQCWLSYAINRKTKQIVNFVIGGRTRENLSKDIKPLLHLNPKKIYTDKLVTYLGLIPKDLHCSVRYQTNRIERLNLNLRAHIKRLSRRTICYSKSTEMFEATIRLYFWGYTLNLLI